MELFSLDGKTVLLTGAAGGIGAALATGLAQAGADMALCDIEEERLKSVVADVSAGTNGRHHAYRINMADIEALGGVVDEVLRDYGKIDVLINCAGVNKREGFLDVEVDTYDKLMNINLKGLFFLSQEVVKKSMKNTGGKIINVGSYNTTSMMGGVSVYGATKSAVYALTRSMCMEWAKFNIHANCVAPGHILTPLTTVTWENEERAAYLRERIALRRPGTPQEIVGTVILLASPASNYISGALFNIDGGALAGGSPWNYDTKY
jgi:NAD(P)-dependent dehydrogenase (short-subunit alcohol dehydrogenase family)